MFSERHCYFTKWSSSVSYCLGGGAPKFVRNFCVRFEVLTEDWGPPACDLLSVCKLFVVSGPLQPLSSGCTKFENCIDLKREIACPSEMSVTLPVRDNFSEDLNLLQEFFPLFHRIHISFAAHPLHMLCSFPSHIESCLEVTTYFPSGGC